jgi:hypothetical protein
MNAKTTAATSVSPTNDMGRRAIAIPKMASVDAISRSTKVGLAAVEGYTGSDLRWISKECLL